ncbi:diguanylate cyclase [Klebsiella variicola]|nr:diguanylate cyclase [Klebsiella variicola]
MTISMGLYTTRDRSVSAETCVERADAAMYEAKTAGVIGWWSGVTLATKKNGRATRAAKKLIFCLEIEDILFKFTN